MAEESRDGQGAERRMKVPEEASPSPCAGSQSHGDHVQFPRGKSRSRACRKRALSFPSTAVGGLAGTVSKTAQVAALQNDFFFLPANAALPA